MPRRVGADRWPSCGEFVAALRNGYTGAGTTEAKRGSRHVLVLAGLLLAITAAAGTLAWRLRVRVDRETVTVAEQSALAGDAASNRLSPLGGTFDSLSSFAPDATTVGLVGRTEYGDTFKDASPDGSLIVGLRLTTGGFGVNYRLTAISSIQPIYLVDGQRKAGSLHGEQQSEPIEIIAKDGYAVAGVRVNAYSRITHIQVVFMRLTGSTLDPGDTYTSEWIGASEPTEWKLIGGSGQPIIGIFGIWTKELRAVGLIEKDSKRRWKIATVQ